MAKFLKSSIAAAALFAVTGLANALTVYTFDSTAVGAFGDGPYGTVALDQVGANVAVTVTLRSDMNFVTTGAKDIFSFNAVGVDLTDIINISNGTASTFVATSPGVNPPFTSGGPTQLAQKFSFGINCLTCTGGGSGQTVDPLSFTVLGASISDLVGLNSSSWPAYFAADVISGSATGAIGVTTPPIPEPETYALMLAGLGAVGFMARRRKAAAVASRAA